MNVRDSVWDYVAYCTPRAIPEFASLNLDSHIYWVRQNVEMPNESPFITLEMDSVSQTGHFSRFVRRQLVDDDYVGDDVVELLTTNMRFNLIFNVYGSGSFENAQMLQMALRDAEAIELMRLKKLGLISIGPVNDISAVVDTIWESRSNFSAVMSYKYVRQNDIAHINHVPIKGDVPAGGNLEIDMVVDGP